MPIMRGEGKEDVDKKHLPHQEPRATFPEMVQLVLQGHRLQNRARRPHQGRGGRRASFLGLRERPAAHSLVGGAGLREPGGHLGSSDSSSESEGGGLERVGGSHLARRELGAPGRLTQVCRVGRPSQKLCEPGCRSRDVDD